MKIWAADVNTKATKLELNVGIEVIYDCVIVCCCFGF
jgi:hypothetical protein